MTIRSPQYWLAELDQYDNPKLVDGSHSDRAGADKAMYLFNGLGFSKGKRYAVAKVELSEPQPSSNGINQEALDACKQMVEAEAPSGETEPRLVGYAECRCILSQYCDGTCRPIFERLASKPATGEKDA